MIPVLGVVTIVGGRHRHLRGQLRSLLQQHNCGPIVHVVVAMGDAEIAPLVRVEGAPGTIVLELEILPDGELPLAAARNAGAAAALAAGAVALVFLDVDCLAHPTLLADYRKAMETHDPAAGPVLWCGEVAYLPPLPDGMDDYPLDDLDEWATPHTARPVVPAGQVAHSTDLKLFWSLNFAVTAADWSRIGGFHPGYQGYGGEDTDLAMTVGTQGGTIGWIGGARSHHQYHSTSSPPWQHLSAIVRNAHVFRARWGWFPMEGWLAAFAEAGAVDYQPASGRLRLRE